MTSYGGNGYYADNAELTVRNLQGREVREVRTVGEKESVISMIMDKLPLAVIATGIITSLFGYVKFIISGGYAEAIARFREYGLFSFDDGVFVNSTAGYVYSRFVVIPVMILLLIAFINAIRMMFAAGGKKGLKTAAVVMLILGISVPFILTIVPVVLGIDLPGNVIMYPGMASLALIIASITIMRRDPDAQPYFGRVLRAALLYFIGLPVAVWAVENIIGFGSIVLGIAITIGVIALFGGLLSSGGGESGGNYSDGGSSFGGSSGSSRALEKKQERLDYLNRKAGEYEHYNKRQAEGAWGYQHFSADKNREVIDDCRREAKAIEAEMAKMRSK